MRISKKKRSFLVGKQNKIKINHKANIFLNENELITFKSKRGKELDIVQKKWGYYLPSINSRLLDHDYKVAYVTNTLDKKNFLLIVDQKKIKMFRSYIKSNYLKFKKWV
jgi:hypothetical protein